MVNTEVIDKEKIESYGVSLYMTLEDYESDCGELTKDELILVLNDVRERWENK